MSRRLQAVSILGVLSLSVLSCAKSDEFLDVDGAIFGVATTTPGFFFYPPWGSMTLAPEPWAPEAYERLSVRIDETNATTGAITRHLQTFSSTTRPRLIRHPPAEGYGVGWDTRNESLVDGTTLRVTIFLDGVELGRSDVESKYFPVIRGRDAMWIKFRVERLAIDADLDDVFDWNDHCPEHPDPTNPVPVAELCDGLDNDCGGDVDNGNPGGGVACQSSALGACRTGVSACTNGAIVCNTTVSPIAESCDGIDNDATG